MWTIQTQGAWERLQRDGVLSGDGRRVTDPEFRGAYRWLMGEMAKRIPGCNGKRFPVWAWHTPKPDLRNSNLLERGTPGVRLTIRLPTTRVLLSDFDAWHFVLNREFVALSEEEYDEWDSRTREDRDAAEDDFDRLPEGIRQELPDSWQRIFDLDLIARYPDWFGPDRNIQAVFEELRFDEVVKAEHFIAR